ncbi:hypothetical protein RSOL_026330 [Rhizoctonia solani AG-3 Rhs1AP]|uniref:Uncharacterized protein n=2 Tax=Rhizoctonia solani AG-3 TaxID=1086053 RepID=A0A074RSE1_9AGAM|nr:hypothetical protein RSOL_026330 [Rhizoctonia solani AG-3 Rhs1AP]KEP49759.1 hypothetical protein V565_093680 [Rhizoctonia solani 123E]
MDNILGLALRPIVSCSAPASRPLAISANSSIQKYSADRVQVPIVLDFQSDKGKEVIRNWYHKQPTTRFTHIEHRKDIMGQFKHEFIVAYLDNSTVCRFDRRAREDMRGHALKGEGTVSEDSAHVITLADTDSKALLDKSEVLMRSDNKWRRDLDFILAVCGGIQSHPEAKSYSLLHYNCYFFSWTLVTIIGRRAHRVREPREEQAQVRTNELVEIIQTSLSKTKQTRFAWGSGLIRLGRSAMGVNPRQESLVNDYILKGMEKAIVKNIPTRLSWGLEEILFPSQISHWLKKEVSLALQEGGRLGVQQFLNETNARSQNSKYSAPMYPRTVALGEIDELDGSTPPVVDMDHTYRSLEERAQRKAEKTLRVYEEMINSLAAGVSIEGKVWNALSVFDYGDCCVKTAREYVTARMADHFKQVESYGFGKSEMMVERTQNSMGEIWVSVLEMMKGKSKFPFL